VQLIGYGCLRPATPPQAMKAEVHEALHGLPFCPNIESIYAVRLLQGFAGGRVMRA
jgi:hypothetical protein